MRPLSSWQRLLPVVFLLAATVVIIKVRDRNEILPAHRDLSTFPAKIEDWQGINLTLAQDQLEVLGPGQFLLRDYLSASPERPLNLFVAYFPSQRTGDTIHSPKNCIPGSGWTPIDSKIISIPRNGGSTISINRYVIAKGVDRDLVYYWYQAHGRVTSSEYWAKIFLVSDAIRINRTDGALIRVVVPITREGELAAQTRGLSFIRQVLPLLDDYIPR
jgi:EpsI family protein